MRTLVASKISRTRVSLLKSKRKAIPQSLDKWRGTGINLIVRPSRNSIFSALNTAEFV